LKPNPQYLDYPIMFSTHTSRIVRLLTVLAFATAVNAEKSPFLSGGSHNLHLSATLSGNNVTISWPKIPGTWELMTQQPADTGDWQSIDPALYHTNNATVTVTQPLPTQGGLYRLRRYLPKLTNLQMPPMPQPPTNRIRPRNLPPSPR
jgi:hypothetical protein